MITQLVECLKYSVGLSERPCNCLGERPAQSDRSDSGLFIDDEFSGLSLKWIQSSLQCQDTLWPLLEKARKSGIRKVIEDFNVAFKVTYDPMIRTFNGRMGEGEEKGKVNLILNPTGSVIGTMLVANKQFIGSSMIITELGLYLSEAGTYDVEIVKRSTNQVLHTVTIEAEEDKATFKTLDNPIELPLVDNFGKRLEYIVRYDRGTARPYNVLWNCNCSSSEKPYEDFVKGTGYEQNGLIETFDSEHTNGLYIGVNIGCRSYNWICDISKHKEEEFTNVFDKAIQLKCQYELLQYLVSTDKINLWTKIAEARLPYVSKKLKSEYEWRIAWLVRKAPDWVTNCYTCSEQKISKGSINV